MLLTTSLAHAAGLDRSGQSVGIIFEEGNAFELSFGSVSPSVTGNFFGILESGNVAPSYNQVGFGIKMQQTDELSLSVMMDQPFGAAVDYVEAGYPLEGTSANVFSHGLTAIGRYQTSPNVSVYGGLRAVTANGNYTRPAIGFIPGYSSDYRADSGLGYVVGAAYEMPEIALRVAATYSSSIDLALESDTGQLTTTLPESINLDFQSGIAADTLLFGSIRWVGWDGFTLTDDNPLSGGDLVAYDRDGVTYNLGIGRRFDDQLSGSVSVGYEKASGEAASDLSPTDGYMSVSLGAAYQLTDDFELSGGVRFMRLGDATTDGLGAEFADNTVRAIGVKLSYNH